MIIYSENYKKFTTIENDLLILGHNKFVETIVNLKQKKVLKTNEFSDVFQIELPRNTSSFAALSIKHTDEDNNLTINVFSNANNIQIKNCLSHEEFYYCITDEYVKTIISTIKKWLESNDFFINGKLEFYSGVMSAYRTSEKIIETLVILILEYKFKNTKITKDLLSKII